MAAGTGVAGITTSSYHHKTLSKGLSDGIDDLATSISTLQAQLDSLAAVVLQNHRGLNLLTADKGGLCIFLDEECCFYFNQSGLAQDAVKKKLKDRAQKIRESSSSTRPSWPSWSLSTWAPWLLPLLVPTIILFLLLIFMPCLIRLFIQFLQNHIQAFTHGTIYDMMLLQKYQQFQNQNQHHLSAFPLVTAPSQPEAARVPEAPPFLSSIKRLEC